MGSQKRDLLVFQVILLVISDSLGARLIATSESDQFLRSKSRQRSNIDKACQNDGMKFKLNNLVAHTPPDASMKEYGSIENGKYRTSNLDQQVISTGVQDSLRSQYSEYPFLNSNTKIIIKRQTDIPQAPPLLQNTLQPSFFTTTTVSSTTGSSISVAMESTSASLDTSSGTSSPFELSTKSSEASTSNGATNQRLRSNSMRGASELHNTDVIKSSLNDTNHQLKQLLDSNAQNPLQLLITNLLPNKNNKPLADQQSDNFFQQHGSQFNNAFSSNSANSSSGFNPLSPTIQVVTTQFQNVGSQITGEANNAAGSNINAGIQNPIQQLIDTFGSNQSNKPQSNQQSDTIFQQLGSQFSNAFGSNSANQSSGSNPLSPITSPFQNVGSQITEGFTNVTNTLAGSSNSANQTSGSDPVGSITSQIQSAGSQIAGGFTNVTDSIVGSSNSANQSQPSIASQLQNVGTQISGAFNNATSAITGANINAGIQNPIQQLIDTFGSNQSNKPQANQQSDTIFQQLGSQIGSAFGSNSANQSSGSNPLSPITAPFQNVGSQITGGISNVTNALAGSSNSANQTSGSNPVGSITSQIQSAGSQIAGGFTNVTDSIVGESNSANQSQTSIASQFQNAGTQITGGFNNATSVITGSNTNAEIQGQLEQLIATLGSNQSNKPQANQQSDTIFQQLGSQISNAFGSNSANQSSNPLSPITSPSQNVGSQITGGISNVTNALAGSSNNANQTSGTNPVGSITSQIQSAGTQIAGGFTNVTDSIVGSSNSANQSQTSIASQLQNVGTQITGGFNNATSVITGSNTNAEIQGQLEQLIATLGPNQRNKTQANQQSDTIFQQLGSQINNAFGSNSANQSSNPLDSIASQFQNVGSQITEGFTNVTNALAGSSNSANQTSGSNPVGSITSQIQSIGSQITEGLTNATNSITGSSNSANQSQPAFSPLDSINSQLQNAGSLFSTGLANTTDAITGTNTSPGIQGQLQQLINSLGSNQSSNNANNTSGSDPSGGITSQLQNIGSQISGGFNNVSSAFTGSNNQANQTSGTFPLESITSQFQNIGSQITGGISNITGAITGSNNNNPAPANTSQDTGVFGPFNPFGSNSANQTSGTNPLSPITTPIQNVGSQIAGGVSNATGGLIPNSPFNQLSPSAVSQASNQAVDALKPTSVQGQLEGISSQLQANIPPLYKDEGRPNQSSDTQQQQQQQIDGSKPSISNDWLGLNFNIQSLLGSHNNNLPTLCPLCTPVCGKTNPRTRRDLRVVGGLTLTPTNKYPWIARFLYFGANTGQGSLINDRIVVTTATLANAMPIFSQLIVQFNIYDLASVTEQRIQKTVSDVIPHPLFKPSKIYDFNIGIVKLASPLIFTSTFMPICLPKLFDSYAGTNAVTVGWGADSLTGQTSTVPLEVIIPLYTDRECMLSNSNLASRNLCGGVIRPAVATDIKATCKGDGGAGLMYPSPLDPTSLTLAGVTIEVPNEGCGEINQLSVFSKTQSYLDFLKIYGYGCFC